MRSAVPTLSKIPCPWHSIFAFVPKALTRYTLFPSPLKFVTQIYGCPWKSIAAFVTKNQTPVLTTRTDEWRTYVQKNHDDRKNTSSKKWCVQFVPTFVWRIHGEQSKLIRYVSASLQFQTHLWRADQQLLLPRIRFWWYWLTYGIQYCRQSRVVVYTMWYLFWKNCKIIFCRERTISEIKTYFK